jgi:hypothetical protein
MKRVASSSSIDTTRTDPIILFDQCPDLMVALVRVCVFSRWDQGGVIWSWRQVSKTAYASVVQVVRDILQPRLRALEVALAAWKDMPLATPFSFPEPRGPLTLTWVELCQNGNRRGARPPCTRQGETAWFRPLFVWAISYVLFPVTRDTDRVDLVKAISNATQAHIPRFEPAFTYFTDNHDDWPKDWENHPYHPKWSRAAEFTPQALLSTFSTGSYGNSLNMAEPGNHQRFTRALLDQMDGFVPAIAFLLLWMQHVTFETHVTDETFLHALHELVLELVFEWRCTRQKERPSHSIFYLWFGDRPETLAYDPVCLAHPISTNRAQRWALQRKAMEKFNDPELRRQLIEKATMSFNSSISKALKAIHE